MRYIIILLVIAIGIVGVAIYCLPLKQEDIPVKKQEGGTKLLMKEPLKQEVPKLPKMEVVPLKLEIKEGHISKTSW
jgi:hypothetical protein